MIRPSLFLAVLFVLILFAYSQEGGSSESVQGDTRTPQTCVTDPAITERLHQAETHSSELRTQLKEKEASHNRALNDKDQEITELKKSIKNDQSSKIQELEKTTKDLQNANNDLTSKEKKLADQLRLSEEKNAKLQTQLGTNPQESVVDLKKKLAEAQHEIKVLNGIIHREEEFHELARKLYKHIQNNTKSAIEHLRVHGEKYAQELKAHSKEFLETADKNTAELRTNLDRVTGDARKAYFDTVHPHVETYAGEAIQKLTPVLQQLESELTSAEAQIEEHLSKLAETHFPEAKPYTRDFIYYVKLYLSLLFGGLFVLWILRCICRCLCCRKSPKKEEKKEEKKVAETKEKKAAQKNENPKENPKKKKQ